MKQVQADRDATGRAPVTDTLAKPNTFSVSELLAERRKAKQG